MGKLNEIQEQVTQSFGNNSFTTKITDTTVEFDSARDSFTFKDEVNVPVIKVDGVQSAPFTAEEKAKLATVTTPMNMKGRVDTAAELPTEGVQVGDVYLVGVSGSENFEEYVCTEISGSPEAPVWENLGHIRVQADWNQNDATKDDYIKNRICYVGDDYETIVSATTIDDIQESYQDGEYEIIDFSLGGSYELVLGKTYRVTVNGIEHEIECSEVYYDPALPYGVDVEDDTPLVNGAFIVFSSSFRFFTTDDNVESVSFKLEAKTETVYQLDEKFIPDTIARVATLPQSDWNQNDNSKADYIKNRICSEETQVFGSAQLDGNASFGAGYYTNDCTPIVVGETYNVTIGSTTVQIEAIDDNGTTIVRFNGFTNLGGGFYYNPNGAFGAPNNEKFAFQGGGDPTLWANATVSIAQSTVTPIDSKFIPQLGGVQFKIAGSPATLQASLDGGSTWQTVTLS